MASMRLEMIMKQKLTQELRMAPHIIQSIEVLTLPALELHNFIQQQLESNPILETGEVLEEEVRERKEEKENIEIQENPVDDDFLNSFENLEREDWQEYYSQNHIPKYNEGEKDKKQEAMQNTPNRPISLQDFIFQQFQLLDLDLEQKRIGEQIIYNIDSKGYLRYPLEEVIQSMKPFPEKEEAEMVLSLIQTLEPLGVGARDIQECLLLQLDPDDQDYYFKKELIEKYLHDIYNNRYPKIAKETGRDLEQIKECIQAIQKLNPKPGANYSSENTPLIMPDIVVEWVGDKYVTRLQEDYIPRLRINPMYIRLLEKNAKKKPTTETKEFVKKKIESANWVIDAIKQRQNTLYRVSQRVIEYQKDFLDHGLTHLKPLKMQDVADDLQIHVSTVSRAISDKHIQTPRGIFAMKFFFTGGIDKKDGANESRVTVQERVQEIINREDKKNPLSDEEIATKLKDVGLEIARRTVTKYRKALGLPSSRIRKEY